MNFGEGYCFIFLSGDEVYSKSVKSAEEIFLNGRISPCLCIDLYEHAYFGDYGFDRKRYISAALSVLDLSKLS